MLLILSLFLIICLWQVKFCLSSYESFDYLSIKNTQAIKGIFIMLVFFSHFNSYIAYCAPMDLVYEKIISLFGQTMVTLFLFYSGYGIMESIKRKGKLYVKQLPLNRILPTLFRFDCAIIIFLLVSIFITKNGYDAKTIILSFVGWESLGNSNWYVFVILLLYLITYFVFKFQKKDMYFSAVNVVVIIFILIFCCKYWNIRPRYWYDTSLCFGIGMFYSLFKNKIESYNTTFYKWILILLFEILLFVLLELSKSTIIIELLKNCVFSLMVVWFTMRVNICNNVLIWLGQHLFEIYILQRLPMIILDYYGMTSNVLIYFILCLSITLILVIPFKQIVDFLWGHLKRNLCKEKSIC